MEGASSAGRASPEYGGENCGFEIADCRYPQSAISNLRSAIKTGWTEEEREAYSLHHGYQETCPDDPEDRDQHGRDGQGSRP